MKEQKKQTQLVSRRKFLGTTAMAATALAVAPLSLKGSDITSVASQAVQGKVPNSKFNGVQVGTITYSWRDMPGSAENILKYCIESGISSLELMGDVIETYAGIPASPTELPEKLTPEQQARLDGMVKSSNMSFEDFKKKIDPPIWKMVVAGVIGTTEEQKKWRLNPPVAKFEELRKMFNNAGVEIHIAKMSPATWSDGEIDYAFKVAKILGAKGITDESSLETAKRLAPFAKKHGIFAAMHNHFQFADKNFNVDEILAVSPSIMLNFDCGHYFGSTGLNPADFIRSHHNRILSLHMKDKTGLHTTPPNENQVWGQGQVPIAEVLLLLKQHAKEASWPKYVDIELEYPVAAWSNSVKEVKTCVAYARQILS
jgi:sugar phosphate isomerase/epimerase